MRMSPPRITSRVRGVLRGGERRCSASRAVSILPTSLDVRQSAPIMLHRVDGAQNGEDHEVLFHGLLSGDADGTRTHGLLRDRHVQIQFAVVRGRLKVSVTSCSDEQLARQEKDHQLRGNESR